MRFDAIVVPRGAEARAVRRGWPDPRPPILAVPAGAAAASALGNGPPLGTAVVLGVCGALDPALHAGDIVVYGRIVNGTETIELDPELAAACAQLWGRAPLAAAAVANVVGEVADKATLRAASGAMVIDMEAAALAHALHARGVRVAMVRAVSDDAAHPLPDLSNIYDRAGSLRPVKLAVALLKTPRRGARFVSDVVTALRALRRAAHRLARNLDS